MPEFYYQTLQAESTGVYKEKRSKFLAFAGPVQSRHEVKEMLERLKRAYFDARHHCFAWVLGPEREEFRAFDDGEPNHSAGDPILGQIRSRKLTYVMVVVVRYFGGVKLGVGGLINAYRSAAEAALDNAVIIEVEVQSRATMEYDYTFTAEVMRLVNEFGLTIRKQEFNESCFMEVDLPLKHQNKFKEKVALMNQLGIRVTVHLAPG